SVQPARARIRPLRSASTSQDHPRHDDSQRPKRQAREHTPGDTHSDRRPPRRHHAEHDRQSSSPSSSSSANIDSSAYRSSPYRTSPGSSSAFSLRVGLTLCRVTAPPNNATTATTTPTTASFWSPLIGAPKATAKAIAAVTAPVSNAGSFLIRSNMYSPKPTERRLRYK